MMIRPAELAAIRRGEIDLAFRRWERPRVKVGTRLRTAVGLLEVVSVEQVTVSSLRAEDARRAGYASVAALTQALQARAERPLFRVGLRHAGADPREELREQVPTPDEIKDIRAWMDRLDQVSAVGPWTRATLEIIDRSPGVRAPELATELGRETLEWKRDVRKLKEKGLTESLAIGYRLSPRGEAVLDHGGPARERAPRAAGTPLPRNIGAPATRALHGVGVSTVEQVASWTRADLAALHGVGPMALTRLGEALADLGLTYRADASE
ncbi:hypothetical protein G7072_08515 [Nocardioides sp. HDW12B]|uniref:hypothetical protein n=1 Tax=Nocardioides sp. HDW12B TaxID=2714939 RepID=UPI00140A6EA9|nr:hypothetical protein [Nocardioides sp. HDW12B]QIK66396.1 hypothetical protein G7072_08515 [Nocardioides sp. HDW12B]